MSPASRKTPKESEVLSLATQYSQGVRAAERATISAEREAQLTTPVSNLFIGLARVAGLGAIELIRETRLDRTRPDFAVVHVDGARHRQKGYIELKAPEISVNASTWTNRNARQWERMSVEAEILIVCNGIEAQIYRSGEPIGETASLPYHDPEAWSADELVKLIRRFLELNPRPITSVGDLSKRLAIRTADLRDRLLWLLREAGNAADAARGALSSWRMHVHPEASEIAFADGISQVIAYGMVLAALTSKNADADGDGIITVLEARQSIRRFSPVLAAAFAPLVDKPVLFEAVRLEIGSLEAIISAIDPDRVNRSADRRGEPWLYFYEDFLAEYDPEERKQAGVYYTPLSVVQAMVAMVDHTLVNRMGKRLGFGDASVVTLDPATGTGTFPLAVIDHAVARAQATRGKAGKVQAAGNLAKGLYAFELLPGPYSVAHLRINQRLHELMPAYDGHARVVLTDTLESPLNPQEQLSLFGDAEVLAAEQNRAKRIKLEQRVTVVLGNPPYRRVDRGAPGRGNGGWVVEGKVPGRKTSKALFDDILDVAKKHTNFAHHASLYNLYVYFWRWSLWKAFEAHGEGPGIVALITASSWLSGPGFVGLRQMVRATCDEAWIIDLGGNNRDARPEDNVFAIETPVAIVVLVRTGKSDAKQPAAINYRRITGSSEEKLAALAEIASSEDPFGGEWKDGPTGWLEPFVPATGDASWATFPKLADIFPWQQPGCKFGRTWPIAPLAETLSERWDYFRRSSVEDRPQLFVTGTSGRNVFTKVDGLPRLADVGPQDSPQPMPRYGYRSFDRQTAFADPRMAKTESPSLWGTWSEKQVYLASFLTGKIGFGPAMTVSAYVPDLHFFRGSYGGKDIIPLYRDADAKKENLCSGLADAIGKRLGIASPNVCDIAAYVYAIMSDPGYYQLFQAELETPGPRVPFTADAKLWAKAVSRGEELLWLHTFAERFQSAPAKRGPNVPLLEGIEWEEAVETLPNDLSEVAYIEADQTLVVGTGRILGVSRSVWEFEVSGMRVVERWIGYRTVKGLGKAASSKSQLDKIRPSEWNDDWNDELLDLIRVITRTIQVHNSDDLLNQIVAGPLILGSELPLPKPSERLPPKTFTAGLI